MTKLQRIGITLTTLVIREMEKQFKVSVIRFKMNYKNHTYRYFRKHGKVFVLSLIACMCEDMARGYIPTQILHPTSKGTSVVYCPLVLDDDTKYFNDWLKCQNERHGLKMPYVGG